MVEIAQPGSYYGQGGPVSFSATDARWTSNLSSNTLTRLLLLQNHAEYSDISSRALFHPDGNVTRRQRERTINRLIKSYPQFQPARRAISQLTPASEQLSDHQEPDHLFDERFVTGFAYVNGSEDLSEGVRDVRFRILAFVGGNHGIEVHFVVLKQARCKLDNDMLVHVGALLPDARSKSVWTGDGHQVRQMIFAQPAVEQSTFLAIRTGTGITVLKLHIAQRRLRNGDQLHCTGFEPVLAFDDQVHQDLEFVHMAIYAADEYVRVAATSSQGDVTVKEYDSSSYSIHSTRIRVYGPEMAFRSEEALSVRNNVTHSIMNDPWRRIQWLASCNLFLICDRRSLRLWNVKENREESTWPGPGTFARHEVIVDVELPNIGEQNLFALTTEFIYVIRLTHGDDLENLSFGAATRLRHFRDPTDLSTRLISSAVDREITITLVSRRSLLGTQHLLCTPTDNEQRHSSFIGYFSLASPLKKFIMDDRGSPIDFLIVANDLQYAQRDSGASEKAVQLWQLLVLYEDYSLTGDMFMTTKNMHKGYIQARSGTFGLVREESSPIDIDNYVEIGSNESSSESGIDGRGRKQIHHLDLDLRSNPHSDRKKLPSFELVYNIASQRSDASSSPTLGEYQSLEMRLGLLTKNPGPLPQILYSLEMMTDKVADLELATAKINELLTGTSDPEKARYGLVADESLLNLSGIEEGEARLLAMYERLRSIWINKLPAHVQSKIRGEKLAMVRELVCSLGSSVVVSQPARSDGLPGLGSFVRINSAIESTSSSLASSVLSHWDVGESLEGYDYEAKRRLLTGEVVVEGSAMSQEAQERTKRRLERQQRFDDQSERLSSTRQYEPLAHRNKSSLPFPASQGAARAAELNQGSQVPHSLTVASQREPGRHGGRPDSRARLTQQAKRKKGF